MAPTATEQTSPYRSIPTAVEATESTTPFSRLYGTPTIQPGESFSGWLYRASYYHRIHPQALLLLFDIQEPADLLDFGSRLTQDIAREIASVTLNEPGTIMAAVLPSMHVLADHTFRCLTFDLVAMVPIYRICTQCLAEDDVPHIRRAWRIAYNLVCIHHPRALMDSCLKCRTRFDFSSNHRPKSFGDDRTAAVRCCQKCGTGLAETGGTRLDDQLWLRLMRFQSALQQIVTSGVLPHPKFGTISARLALESYLSVEHLEYPTETVTRFSAIDFHRCFGIHAGEVLRAVSPASQSHLVTEGSRTWDPKSGYSRDSRS